MLAVSGHTGPWLGLSPGALAGGLCDAQASSHHGVPGPRATVPRERAEWTLYCLSQHSFGSRTTFATVYLSGVGREGQPYSRAGE